MSASAEQPSTQQHCGPCALAEINSLHEYERSSSTHLVQLYAWHIMHPDSDIDEFVASSYRTDKIGARYQAAADCAEMIVRGECPLFRYIQAETPEESIIPIDWPGHPVLHAV